MTVPFEELRSQASSVDEDERLQAVRRLYESRDIRAVPILRALASQDASVRVRYTAKKAIFLIRKMMDEELGPGQESAVPTPETLPEAPAPEGGVLQDSEHKTHITVKPEGFKRAFLAADAEKRVKYVQAAVRYNAREILGFLCEQAGQPQHETVRATLAISIGILGSEDQIQLVAGFLKDEDPRVRANAVEGLEYLGHPKVYPIIVRFLQDPDNRIRGNVIKALQNYGKVNLLKILEQMMDSGKPWMRDSAAYALSVISSEVFLPLLRKASEDPDREVRRKIRTALERLAAKGNAEATELLRGFSDQTTMFQSDMFEDLEPFSDTPARESKALLEADDPATRRAEVDRIVQEKDVARAADVAARLAVEPDQILRATIVSALGRLADPAGRAALEAALSDEVPRVRANAVEALSVVDGAALVPHAERLLKDPNNRVRANAVVALKDLKPLEALEALGEMVYHPDELWRRSAFWAITDIADERIVNFVAAFLEDEREELRVRAVHFVHELKEQDGDLAEEIVDQLGTKARELLMGPLDTTGVASAFTDDLAERASRALAAASAAPVAPAQPSSPSPAASPAPSPAPATPSPDATDPGVRRFKYDAFKNLPDDRKLATLEEAKAVITVGTYYFLRDVLQKEKDFVVKVAARRALKGFEAQDFAQERLVSEESEPDFLKSPEIQAVEYHGTKQVLQLSQDLVSRDKKREVTGAWFGPFPEQFQILNALREDTQDMLGEVLRGEELVRATICFYQPMLRPFMAGERSLDMNRYANIVTLAGAHNRLDLYSPSRPFLGAIKNPVYLLAVLTVQRVVLFLRGPIEGTTARWREIWYRQITKLTERAERDVRCIELTVGTDVIELPELRPDEAEKLHEFIKRESIDKIRSEERFIDIDFSEELKKLDVLRKGGVISEIECQYRRDRLLKMDKEKFSEKNVQRILTRRYKDDKLAGRMDQQLMNRFRDELTIMFTDIVGYSRKTSQKRILDLLTILAIHDSLLLPKVRQFDGALVKKMGDALMISFKDPANAVRCAKAMQEALAGFNQKNDDEILIRIGVNTGEVFVKDGDIFGEAVNTAQSMEAFCEPGKIYLTERTHQLVRDAFPCSDRGSRKLKDQREIPVFCAD